MKFLTVALIVFLLVSCGENATTLTAASIDSLAEVDVKPTPDEKPKVDQAKINELGKHTIEKKDEFKQTSWIHPKSEPRYRNQNGFYCYFAKNREDSSAFNFRFVIQYVADDWLFIENCDFLIDGKPYSYTPSDFERDNGDGLIWEWADEHIGAVDEPLIAALASAKTAKVRLNGNQYYQERSLSSAHLLNIKRMYELYKAMGGVF